MGDPRQAEYGLNIWRQRLADVQAEGIEPNRDVVVEIGPGRNLSACIAAIIDGTKTAIAVDAVKYASMQDNQKLYDKLILKQPEQASRTSVNDQIRAALSHAGEPDKESVLKYKAPWSDVSIIDKDSVDFIFSISVLEHVNNPQGLFIACYQWLRPGGIMSHKIDYSSHGITRTWNAHYWLPGSLWKLVMGKRSYLINRWPPSRFKAAAEAAGFEIVAMNPVRDDDKITDIYAMKTYNGMPEDSDDLYIRTNTMVLRKPGHAK